MNTWWWEIDIHGCYSLVKISFAPIGKCNNNQRIWHQNVSSRDVTNQLWWRHNAKSEKNALADNGKMSERWLFLAELCVQNIKWRVRNKTIYSLPWIRHLWKLLANHLTRDQKIVIHGNSCIILCLLEPDHKIFLSDKQCITSTSNYYNKIAT